MKRIRYEGNRFSIRKTERWYGTQRDEYSISVDQIDCERVCLPESFDGVEITCWDDWKHGNSPRFDGVKQLYIPASVNKIHVCSDIFPELEEVVIDPANKWFYTDGRLIISRKEDELLYCPVCRGANVEIPDCVKRIAADAFRGTQYEEIRFPNRDLTVSSRAFDGSRWLDLQGDIVVIGTLLYRFRDGIKRLTVPESVRKIHPSAFSRRRCPCELETPVLPTAEDIAEMNDSGRCGILRVTSPAAHINMTSLRRWESLREVEIADGHKQYRTSGGVIYSRDGRTLMWYPCERKGDVFAVPDGVRKIAAFAFANQRWLKEIILPESVSSIGTGAFSKCRSLERVALPSRIKELPDAGIFRRTGVFSECPNLQSMVLPQRMTYLGSFAFYRSGLRSIELGECMEQLGEYALMAEGLKEIRLPPGVKRLGKGSLFYAEKVEAYEGAAKGIVEAVNTCWPDEKNNNANLKWSCCRITVLHRRSERRDFFMIPGTLKRSAVYHLELAWNGDHIDYEEYDQCLEGIGASEEKMEFAGQGLLRIREGENNVYEDYIRRVSFRLGRRLLEEGREDEFLFLIKRGFLSENSLSKLLTYSNELGLTVCSAYITDALRKMKGTRKRNAGFRI